MGSSVLGNYRPRFTVDSVVGRKCSSLGEHFLINSRCMLSQSVKVGIIGIIVVDRPQTTPTSLLTVHSSILLSEAIILCNNFRPLHAKDLPDILQACVAVVSIVLIMNMPMRNPNLSTIKIAAISNSPTYDLRSPEDNLTLWQFMTVTWMSPLISVGSKRQLNDEDVWFLGYEFQHRGLHQNFRELQGSVVMRLLHANGVDLVLTSLLGIIEQCASMCSACFFHNDHSNCIA